VFFYTTTQETNLEVADLTELVLPALSDTGASCDAPARPTIEV